MRRATQNEGAQPGPLAAAAHLDPGLLNRTGNSLWPRSVSRPRCSLTRWRPLSKGPRWAAVYRGGGRHGGQRGLEGVNTQNLSDPTWAFSARGGPEVGRSAGMGLRARHTQGRKGRGRRGARPREAGRCAARPARSRLAHCSCSVLAHAQRAGMGSQTALPAMTLLPCGAAWPPGGAARAPPALNMRAHERSVSGRRVRSCYTWSKSQRPRCPHGAPRRTPNTPGSFYYGMGRPGRAQQQRLAQPLLLVRVKHPVAVATPACIEVGDEWLCGPAVLSRKQLMPGGPLVQCRMTQVQDDAAAPGLANMRLRACVRFLCAGRASAPRAGA